MADIPKLHFVSRINLLRVIAVAGISFHHLWNGISGMRNASALTELLHPFFMLAAQGVGIFNIITGFVLAWPCLGPGHKPPLGWADFQKFRLSQKKQGKHTGSPLQTIIAFLSFLTRCGESV